MQFGYGLNYLIEIENAVIVDVEATPARTYDEVAATQTMLARAEERFNLKPKRLVIDTKRASGQAALGHSRFMRCKTRTLLPIAGTRPDRRSHRGHRRIIHRSLTHKENGPQIVGHFASIILRC